MTDLIIDWNQISQVEWERRLTTVDHSAFQQAWAYGAIYAHGQGTGKVNVARFVVYDGSAAIGMGQIVTRRFFGFLKIALLLRGPVWFGEVTVEQKKQVLHKIRKRYPLKTFNLFAFSPEEAEGLVSYEAMGFRKVITGFSTVMIDLKPSEDQLWQNLYGKNRTSIRKAEKYNFKVIFGDHNHPHVEWLLSHEKKQQKDKKYQGLPVGLVQKYGYASMKEKGVLTAFIMKEGEETPLAGALFLRHGNCATYHIGCNGKEVRQPHALNLLLWKMIIKLKSTGIKTVDMGVVNTK